MTPEEIDELIGVDELDAVIDEWAAEQGHGEFDEPKTLSLMVTNYDQCQALTDLAAEAIDAEKRRFEFALAGDRSSEACSAAFKVVALRKLLRQLHPIRDAIYPIKC